MVAGLTCVRLENGSNVKRPLEKFTFVLELWAETTPTHCLIWSGMLSIVILYSLCVNTIVLALNPTEAPDVALEG